MEVVEHPAQTIQKLLFARISVVINVGLYSDYVNGFGNDAIIIGIEFLGRFLHKDGYGLPSVVHDEIHQAAVEQTQSLAQNTVRRAVRAAFRRILGSGRSDRMQSGTTFTFRCLFHLSTVRALQSNLWKIQILISTKFLKENN